MSAVLMQMLLALGIAVGGIILISAYSYIEEEILKPRALRKQWEKEKAEEASQAAREANTIRGEIAGAGIGPRFEIRYKSVPVRRCVRTSFLADGSQIVEHAKWATAPTLEWTQKDIRNRLNFDYLDHSLAELNESLSEGYLEDYKYVGLKKGVSIRQINPMLVTVKTQVAKTKTTQVPYIVDLQAEADTKAANIIMVQSESAVSADDLKATSGTLAQVDATLYFDDCCGGGQCHEEKGN